MLPRFWPVVLAAIMALSGIVVALGLDTDAATQWHLAARYTARAGFPFLIIAFIASSLVRLWPNQWTKAILRDRKWWGLAFATAHTFHLYALVNAVRLSPTEPNYLYLSPAIFGYAILYAMAATSWPWAYKAMGKWWKRLHKFGIYYLWFIFAAAYLLKSLDPAQHYVGAVLGTVAIAALALRYAAWTKAQAKRRAVAA